jgi:A1 cistron-splicing factor AAR2
MLRRCATVVVTGVPVKTSLGVDAHCFSIGPNFMGLKLVPPGLHLLTTSVGEEFGTTALFLLLRAGEVRLLEWSREREHLVPSEDGGEAQQRFAAAVQRLELDARLAAYSEEQAATWRALVSHVTAAVVGRVEPVGGLIQSDTELGSLADEARGGSQGGRGSKLYFTPLPGLGRGARAEDRTAYAQDSSFALLAAATSLLTDGIASDGASLAEQLIGEMQVAYILFVNGRAYSGLEAWKRLVDSLCRAEDILTAQHGIRLIAGAGPRACDALPCLNQPFFEAAFSALRSQLRTLPRDLFQSDLSKDNFLAPAVSALMRTFTSPSVTAAAEAGAAVRAPAVRSAVRALTQEWASVFGAPLAGPEVVVLLPDAAPAAPRGHETREELLAALEEEGDLPVIMDE